MKSRTQSGVALVITLLMLSVITFLTVAFLTLSRRDRAAVGMSLTQREARNMADAALQRAQVDIVTRMLSATNPWGTPEILNYDLMVSRNYIATNGFEPARNVAFPNNANGINTTNVSYQYANGNPVNNPDDFAMLVGNLFYDPRPPVLVKTNSNPASPLDFRFWIDLNRNGRFETNGLTAEVDDRNRPLNTAGNVAQPADKTNFLSYAAEPEWIGMLRCPEYPHSATNPFIGRYAYLVTPIGKTLDLNHVHNFAKSLNLNTLEFRRNQGVGSWEINLAGLFANLNTNTWNQPGNAPYRYYTDTRVPSGFAFADAKSILTNRYYLFHPENPNFPVRGNLASANWTLGTRNNFRNDQIDDYSDGDMQLTSAPLTKETEDPSRDGWSGSDNPKAFYETEELFTRTNTSLAFTNRLLSAGTNNSSYDRYTFARLLASIGTGSEPELQVDIHAGRNSAYRANTWDRRTKVNLNYDNSAEIARGANTSQTNFNEWTPLAFFTNAADLILRSQFDDNTNYTITNLWIYSANTNNRDIRYSAKLHRALQLAANLYDATTNANGNMPSVFRPLFRATGTAGRTNYNVYITGFEEVTNNARDVIRYGFVDINKPLPKGNQYNVWGVPWVIGAKKGLPNFNEYYFSNTVSLVRKLQFFKNNLDAPPTTTNQMYIFALTNYSGIEVWNSYRSNWNRSVFVIATNQVQIAITNETGRRLLDSTGKIPTGYTNSVYQVFSPATLTESNALRSFTGAAATNSTWVPLQTNAASLPYSRFDEADGYLKPVTNEDSTVYPGSGALTYHSFGLQLTNRFFYAMIDWSADSNTRGRLIDLVNFGEFGFGTNLLDAARNEFQNRVGSYNPWATNNNGLAGISNQIAVALGIGTVPNGVWDSQINAGSQSQSDFKTWWDNSEGTPVNRYMASPFQPQTTIPFSTNFAVNDPLVHYTQDDLAPPQNSQYLNSMGAINPRSSTWLGSFASRRTGNKWGKMILTDPQITCSDDWDFPTNKFPNVGWIGRVHRGTPWQTIYLKADSPEGTSLWPQWVSPGNLQNSRRDTRWDTYPTNDWSLPDLFTVAPNDNAARGTLSVNQTNLAAWSAIFSGVVALKDAKTSVVIDPTNVPSLIDGANGLNAARAKRLGKLFHKTGEILAAPALTTNSPFIGNLSNTNVTDAVVERIPQQTLSLLKVGQPRFVIWAYGQSLKPQSVYMGSKYPYLFGMSTNYQITGESLTRTVCRLEYGNSSNTVPRIVVESFNVVPGDQ